MRSHAQPGSSRRPAAPSDRRRTMVLSGLLAATAIVGAVAWSTRADDAAPSAAPVTDPATAAPATAAQPADATVARLPAPPLVTIASGAETATGTPGSPTLATSPPDAADTAPAATSPVTSPVTSPATSSPATSTPDGTSADASVSLDGTDPGLQAAFAAAAAALDEAGLELVVNSGYRTADHQRRLLDEAVAEYGSYEEASRWVFEPERSMHVQGLAVDVGSGPAADWLQQHGERFGICQTLAWEWWHFEWRQAWQTRGACPAAVDDPADAPGADVP